MASFERAERGITTRILLNMLILRLYTSMRFKNWPGNRRYDARHIGYSSRSNNSEVAKSARGKNEQYPERGLVAPDPSAGSDLECI